MIFYQNLKIKNYDKNIILTTEKDKVKLTNFIDYFKGIKIYYIQIKVNIENYEKFNNEILKYVTNYKRKLKFIKDRTNFNMKLESFLVLV